MPREPPTTSTVPTERLWSSEPLGTSSGATPSSVSSQTSASWSHSGGMPIGATTTSPLSAPPGVTKWPTLAACSVTVRSATTAGPCTAPVLGADAAGDVDADHGAGRLVDELDGRGGGALGGAREPGAEDGVDDDVGHLREHHGVLGERPVVVDAVAHVHAELARGCRG